MQIEKINENRISISGEKTTLEIEFSQDGLVNASMKNQESKTMSFVSPGEYEVGDLGVEAREFPSEDYKSVINFLKVNVGSADILCVFSEVNIKKEELGNLSDFSILLVSNVSIKYLKEIINKLDVNVVTIFSNKESVELIESFRKDLGYEVVDKNKKYKFKDSELENLEDSTLVFNVLE